MKNASCTLDVLLSRDKNVGVILRRGPTKQVLLIRWDLKKDTFEEGQWLKGRIHPERCCLSPDGEYLVYFASAYGKSEMGTWTAVSKPPYLTALALWPAGDSVRRGGYFHKANELVLWLPHTGEPRLDPGFKLKRNLEVLGSNEFIARYPKFAEGLGEAGYGFYPAICCLRDGWELFYGDKSKFPNHSPNPPEPIVKWSGKTGIVLIPDNATDSNLYFGTYFIVDKKGTRLATVPSEVTWMDFADGDVVFTIGGKLYRISGEKSHRFEDLAISVEKPIADFSDLKFREMVAPAAAQKW